MCLTRLRFLAGTRDAFPVGAVVVSASFVDQCWSERIRHENGAAALFAAVLMMLAGCNTIEGAGKDVKSAGAAVERAADKTKPH